MAHLHLGQLCLYVFFEILFRSLFVCFFCLVYFFSGLNLFIYGSGSHFFKIKVYTTVCFIILHAYPY